MRAGRAEGRGMSDKVGCGWGWGEGGQAAADRAALPASGPSNVHRLACRPPVLTS